MAKGVHGPEFDPRTDDIDGDVHMRVGGGKRHGRYWIADDTINLSSTPTLSQTQLKEKRQQRVELEARLMAEREAERATRIADQQRIAEMYQYMQSLGATVGLALPPVLFPTTSPHQFSTLNQSAASNDPMLCPTHRRTKVTGHLVDSLQNLVVRHVYDIHWMFVDLCV